MTDAFGIDRFQLVNEQTGIALDLVPDVEGLFESGLITLSPGENILRLMATDTSGNQQILEISALWAPRTSIRLETPPSAAEASLLRIPIILHHEGDVSGATFVIQYDSRLFESPVLTFGPELERGLTLTNSQANGKLTASFAVPGISLPSKEVVLGELKMRVRSVPPDGLSTLLTLEIQDISDATGTLLEDAAHTTEAHVNLEARRLQGDTNANGFLDTGDAHQMLSFLTETNQPEAWDGVINDLNGNGNLDVGDVVRVLATVAGIHPQPDAVPALLESLAFDPTRPRFEIVQNTEARRAGDLVEFDIVLKGGSPDVVGAAFELEYPAHALRLADATHHKAGNALPANSQSLWNIAPSVNDYEAQNGRATFAVSAPEHFSAESPLVLVTLQFEAHTAFFESQAFVIRLTDGEVSRENGYVLDRIQARTKLIPAEPLRYARWILQEFDPEDLTDLSATDLLEDPDNDHLSNLVEFYLGTSPIRKDAQFPRLEWIPGIGDEMYPALTFTRMADRAGAHHFLEYSQDLQSWTLDAEAETRATVNESLTEERITLISSLDRENGGTRYLRLRVSTSR